MKVAIIGAGMAGLTAATELKRKGATVQVFEKSRGTGGRLASKRLDWAHFDIGAQYFTARTGGLYARVKQWQAAGVAAQWVFTPHKVHNGSIEASPDDEVRFVGTPRMTSIARHMADNLDVTFETRIQELDYDGKRWTLYTDCDKEYTGFDWVICSIPAEQAAVVLDTCSDLTSSIPEEVHYPCWALALATRGQVASDIQGIFGDGIISWVSRESAKPGRLAPEGCDDVWMLHFSPQWSADNPDISHERVAAAGLSWLESRLGVSLTAERHFCHFWRYAQLADRDSPRPYRLEASRHLAIIGAWCCGGRVEGAFESAMLLVEDHFE